MKTGECYWRDVAGVLWLAESFCDEAGNVTTTQTKVADATDATQEQP